MLCAATLPTPVRPPRRLKRQRLAIWTVVFAVHGAALTLSWQATPPPAREAEPQPLFINFVTPAGNAPMAVLAAPQSAPAPQTTPAQPRPNRPDSHRTAVPVQALDNPAPRAATAPTVQPQQATATAPGTPSATSPAQPQRAVAAEQAGDRDASSAQSSPTPTLPAGNAPLELGSQWAATCPERPAPAYPALSRRMGETGNVVLRVELDERGTIAAAQVEHSSGYTRLDAAAMAAIRAWRCTAALRDGLPVKAIARQPFNFVLGA